MDGSSRDRLAAAEQQASDRLRDLQERVAVGNDALYRHLALYLQVLREGLLPLVQQACFRLITADQSGTPGATSAAGSSAASFSAAASSPAASYAALPEAKRLELQERIRHLVARCSSLLTVEQLLALAQQRQQRESERRQQSRAAFLEAIANREPDAETEITGSEAGPQTWHQSINLALEPPISADLFTHGLPGLAGLPSLADALGMGPGFSGADPGVSPAGASQEPVAADRSLESMPSPSSENAAAAGSDSPLSAAALSAAGMPGMEALMALASAGADLINALSDSPASEPADPDDGRLPRDPEQLLRRWHQLDQALAHRLRTLSHALNGLLVRSGLSRTVIPIPLLDAVLQGQIGALPAPANLVRVQIPMPLIGVGNSEQQQTVIGVLLRPSDLEFEHPPLRTCRQRLDQHRRDLRRMAQHHRAWQRRHQSIQAQMLWENDLDRTTHPQDENA